MLRSSITYVRNPYSLMIGILNLMNRDDHDKTGTLPARTFLMALMTQSIIVFDAYPTVQKIITMMARLKSAWSSRSSDFYRYMVFRVWLIA